MCSPGICRTSGRCRGFPWVYEALVRARRGNRSGWLALPPLLALCFVAGHPQEWYLLVLGIGAVALHDLMKTRDWPRGLAWAGVIALSLGLVGLELVPILKARPWTAGKAGGTLAMADRFHLGPANLAQWVSPNALGNPAGYVGPGNWWESQASVGLVVGVLVLVAGFGPRRRPLVRGLLAAVLMCGVFAAGRSLGVFSVLFHVLPGMGEFRTPARVLFLAQPLVAVLAAVGLETVSRDGGWFRWGRWIGFGVVLVVCAWGLVEGVTVSRPSGHGGLALPSGSRLHSSLPWVILCQPGFWIAVSGMGRRGAIVWAVAAVAELAVYGVDLIRVAPPERFLAAGPMDGVLASDVGVRVRARDWFYEDAMAARLGLSKANVGDGFQVRHATELVERLYPMFHPAWDVRGEALDEAVEAVRRLDRQAILDRLAVGWLVDEGPPDPSLPWDPVATGPWRGTSYTVYRNPTALPRAYVVPGAVVDRDSRRIRLHDPRQVVMMDMDPLGQVAGPRQAFRPAELDATDPDRKRIRVRTEGPGLLVVADTWMPGWSATLDGRPVEILLGNRAQRVVAIPSAGEHVIEMVYRTPGLDLGMAISAGALVVWAGLAARWVGCGTPRTSGTRGSAPRDADDTPVNLDGGAG